MKSVHMGSRRSIFNSGADAAINTMHLYYEKAIELFLSIILATLAYTDRMAQHPTFMMATILLTMTPRSSLLLIAAGKAE